MTFSEKVLSSSKSSAGRLKPGTMVNGKYEIKACVGAGAHGLSTEQCNILSDVLWH